MRETEIKAETERVRDNGKMKGIEREGRGRRVKLERKRKGEIERDRFVINGSQVHSLSIYLCLRERGEGERKRAREIARL